MQRGEDRVWTPSTEIHKNKVFLSNDGMDPLDNHKATSWDITCLPAKRYLNVCFVDG